LHGYEIHMGETCGAPPWLEVTSRNGQAVHIPDGATSTDGRVWGCYLHGIFTNDRFRHLWLESLGWQDTGRVAGHAEQLERALETLADAVADALDMEELEKIVWEN
jgi:adenosylcobyric acid synthase